MTPEELRRDEAARWLAAAARDLKSARLLAGEENTGSVFHSQQAAEKSAKAFLAFHNVPFRKTHDLQELGKQCVNLDTSLADVLAEAENLTDYAVIFRYQDAPYEPDQAEATSALEIARGAVRTSAITRDLTNATTTHERVGYPLPPQFNDFKFLSPSRSITYNLRTPNSHSPSVKLKSARQYYAWAELRVTRLASLRLCVKRFFITLERI